RFLTHQLEGFVSARRHCCIPDPSPRKPAQWWSASSMCLPEHSNSTGKQRVEFGRQVESNVHVFATGNSLLERIDNRTYLSLNAFDIHFRALRHFGVKLSQFDSLFGAFGCLVAASERGL